MALYVLLFCCHRCCSCQVVSDSFVTLWTLAHEAPLSMGFPGKSTGVGCHSLLQAIFLTQRSNPRLLHWQKDSLALSHVGSPFIIYFRLISSVQFSLSVMFSSLQPHESQHSRPSCPSPTPGVYPNPCPLSQWCHPAISSSVVPFSSCPQSFPASRSFPMSQLFTWDGQSIGVSASD